MNCLCQIVYQSQQNYRSCIKLLSHLAVSPMDYWVFFCFVIMILGHLLLYKGLLLFSELFNGISAMSFLNYCFREFQLYYYPPNYMDLSDYYRIVTAF